MIQGIIIRSALPLLIGGILGASAVVGIQRLSKQSITVSCPEPKVNVSCPQPKIEGNGIDIEKIKGLKGKLSIEQHYHVTMSADSMIINKMTEEIREELERLKVVRCKK